MSRAELLTLVTPQVVQNMSNDRRLLYKTILGVSNGDLSDVEGCVIGKQHQARWLTTADRAVYLYGTVKFEELSEFLREALERLVIFIIKVYFKVCIDYHTSIISIKIL